jgi:hypothetical protein
MRTARFRLAFGLAIAGCDGNSGPSGALCTAPVAVSVAGGLSPQITWTPACLVQQVLVLESIPPSVGGPQPRWAVQQVSGGIASPVHYGQVPSGAQVTLAAEALMSGRSYVVQLSMTELVGSSSIVGEVGFNR